MPCGLAFSYADSGLLLYRLDAGRTESVAHIEVDQSAKADDFATKTIRHFQAKARRFFPQCSRPGHVEEAMLTREGAFWDDLVLSFKYPTNSHYSSLATLWTLRQALHFRYEGQLPQIGVLFTWNISKFLASAGTVSIPLTEKPLLAALLKQSKASHFLSDGAASIYVVRGERAVQLMYRSSLGAAAPGPGLELVPSQYRWLVSAVQGRDMAILNSGVGEQLLITSKAVLKWVGGQWTLLSHNLVANLLPSTYSDELRNLLLDVVGRLSQQHIGALILLPDDVDNLLNACQGGMAERLSGRRFLEVSSVTRPFFERLCSIDGAVVVDCAGYLVDAGLIVKLPTVPATEGARSSAALAASQYGLAIKVSHDGPITFFRGGQRIATVS